MINEPPPQLNPEQTDALAEMLAEIDKVKGIKRDLPGSKLINDFYFHSIMMRMMEHNQNWLCLVVGGTGSGKSYLALKIAEELDSTFNASRVAFNAEEFMSILNDGQLQKGCFIIFDEAGVGMSAREWFSLSNKALNYVLQTFRFRNIGVIFTTPDMGFIDVNARKLFHTYVETIRIDRNMKVCVAKVMEMQNNPKMGEQYTKYPRQLGEVMKRYCFHLPSKDLIKAYELKKTEYGLKLQRDIGQELKESGNTKAGAKNDEFEKIADEIIATGIDRVMIKGKLSHNAIAFLYKLTPSYGSHVKKIVELKLNSLQKPLGEATA